VHVKVHTEAKQPHAGKWAHEVEWAHRGKGSHKGELKAWWRSKNFSLASLQNYPLLSHFETTASTLNVIH